jgi:hypothetical protein
MHTTEQNRAPLARRPLADRIHPRLEMRRRLSAFVELFADAPKMPAALNNLTRAEPRTKLYDERQREVIHAGIRDGLICRERLIRFRASQLMDDFAQFPDEASAHVVTYVRLMLEEAEAVHAQTIAHAMPTPGNIDTAIRETKKLVAVAELECAVLRAPLPSHASPMDAQGATR